MGSFNDFMSGGLGDGKARALNATRQAQFATLKNNPNATAADYIKAGMRDPFMASRMAKEGRLNALRNIGSYKAPAPPTSLTSKAVAQAAATGVNQLQPNAISPKALSNQAAIGGVFGTANPGTFTRTVGNGPLAQTADQGQMTSQGYIPAVDPTNPTEQTDVESIMADTNGALQGYEEASMPPAGVGTPITPNYDLNNL